MIFSDEFHLFEVFPSANNVHYLVSYDPVKNTQAGIFKDEIRHPKIIRLNNESAILYKSAKVPYEENKNRTQKFEYKIYDLKTNSSKVLHIPNLYIDYENPVVGQSENGLLFISSGEEVYKHILYAIDLNAKKIVYANTDYIFQDYYPHFIWLGDDKFLSAEKYNHRIRAFKIQDNGKILLTNLKQIKPAEIWEHTKIYTPENAVVLDSDTVIFSTGFTGMLHPGFVAEKETYLYKYSTNEYKRLADFFYKAPWAKYVKLDNNSFLIYDAWLNCPKTASKHDFRGIYKFKLRGER